MFIQKILLAAEAVWSISSDSSNINRIVIDVYAFNQFMFNVSIVLLVAALGNSTAAVKSKKLPLVKLDDIFDRIEQLDLFKDKKEKQSCFDFLILFQTFQRLMSTSAARDESLHNVLAIQAEQLERLKNHLQTMLLGLNRTINDQKDLNENTTISHCIQLILTNMDNINSNLI